MFTIQPVQKSEAVASEQLGSKYKFWFNRDNRRFLFKADDRGTGEDWAEKVADCLAELLWLPHVHYELAELYEGNAPLQPGVVCETCAPPPQTLVLGNQLLLAFDPSYPMQSQRKFRVREHTVPAVAEVLRVLLRPPSPWCEHLPDDTTALDVFVGYLMLDAWIANQDRHHENWGALHVDPLMLLAPTFDHGAALARNLTDGERQERLTTRDKNRTIASFAVKARSAFYQTAADLRPLGTLEAFFDFAKFAAHAAVFWTQRLARIDETAIREILLQVPQSRMSPITREFTLQLLLVNQKRILESPPQC
jgi:hypothetical protein